MGLQIDRDHFDDTDYARFAERLQENLGVLRELLSRPGFGEGETTLGAELELFIIDRSGRALPINRALLKKSLDSHLQLELDRFNLEYNLTPVLSAGQPFSALVAELGRAIVGLNTLAASQQGRVVPIGILPTLRLEDLHPSVLSDLPRYRALSSGIRRMRQDPFEIRIDGPEPLTVTCDDVVLEGANTSFQVHLRVAPDDFAATYNAVQLATPIALAMGANSPIFLGHRLWDETRVALFKQSIDHRTPEQAGWRRPARVSFGHGWVRHGAYELFAEAVGLFPSLIPITGNERPLIRLREGELPDLAELRLHQGTVWRWNRPVYDPAMGGHLRIEMRALPAGPTPCDMVASGAFLIGMAAGLRSEIDELLPCFPFEYGHYNFYRAAQQGVDALLLWPSKVHPSPREVPVRQLASELLPVAEQGLASLGVENTDIRRMFDVIRARITMGMTGARWQRSMLDQLETRLPRQEALATMLEAYLCRSLQGRPVAEWSMES